MPPNRDQISFYTTCGIAKLVVSKFSQPALSSALVLQRFKTRKDPTAVVTYTSSDGKITAIEIRSRRLDRIDVSGKIRFSNCIFIQLSLIALHHFREKVPAQRVLLLQQRIKAIVEALGGKSASRAKSDKGAASGSD